MISPEPYAEIDLPGNYSVKIYDHSRVYFGDYFRVALEVRCEIPLPVKTDKSANEVGETLDVAVYCRYLEKMAVPSAEVDDVRMALIAEFRRNSLPYLATPDFPVKMVARTLRLQTNVKKSYSVSGC